MESNNSNVVCPVCEKMYKSRFAMDGHMRLTMDADHIAFRQQKQQIKPPNQDTGIPIMQPTINDTRTVLKTLLKNKERQLFQDANDDNILQKIEDMLSKEREADEEAAEENYLRGWNDRDKQCQEEINDVRSNERNETEKQCQEKISAACTEVRNEAQKQCQKSVNAAFKQDKDKYIFYHWCSDCNREIPIEPGSAYYSDLTDLLRWMGIICPECSRDRGLPPRFHSLSYFAMSNKIANLEKELLHRDIAEIHRRDEERHRQEREIDTMKTMLTQQRKNRI